MKRHRLIDPQGHTERPAGIPAAIACATCPSVRIRGMPWRHPCAGQAEATERAAAPVHGVHPARVNGFYRGVAKPGS